ncbi:MAG: hypothetical protein IBX68_04790 [Dehalococcoidia bacterium]|nr:hypothetical protein [Dehalococcoidia bacterium]
MGRRDQWQDVRQSMMGDYTKPKSMEELERIPEKACGLCKNFSENAYASDGRGYCNILKHGSNIQKDPPVFLTTGDVGFMTFFNTDASRCIHFTKMQFIDTDGTECADPAFRRMQRQMEKFNNR